MWCTDFNVPLGDFGHCRAASNPFGCEERGAGISPCLFFWGSAANAGCTYGAHFPLAWLLMRDDDLSRWSSIVEIVHVLNGVCVVVPQCEPRRVLTSR